MAGETLLFCDEAINGAALPEPEPELSLAESFEELEGILYLIASSPAQHRHYAVRYMRCRNRLMASEARPTLPGFMMQTGTVDKYRDFITLYDANVEARHAFLDQAFSRCRGVVGSKRPYDGFDDLDF